MFKQGVWAVALIASWVLSAPARAVDVGDIAPEIQADRWYNAPGTVSLAQLRGHVVVVEFWATYCGPCHAIQPKLAAIHERLGPKGVVLISMSDEPEAVVTPFISHQPASYIRSAGGDTPRRYGIRGIPAAFVVDQNGVIAWRGNPHEGGFEDAIERTLGSSKPQPSFANRGSVAATGGDELEEIPPSAKKSANSSTGASSSSQDSFEGGATKAAKKASVAKSSPQSVKKTTPAKQKSGSKVAVGGSKTSSKAVVAAKSKQASSKAKSARLVKKDPSDRKSAKRK